jgi:hypothetical protein
MPRGRRLDSSATSAAEAATWLSEAAADLRQVGDPQRTARLAVLRALARDRRGADETLRELRAALRGELAPPVLVACRISRLEASWHLGRREQSRREAARLVAEAVKAHARVERRGLSRWTLLGLVSAQGRMGDVSGVRHALECMRRLGLDTDEAVRTVTPLLPLAEARSVIARFLRCKEELLGVQLNSGDLAGARRTVMGLEVVHDRLAGHARLALAALDEGDHVAAARDVRAALELRTTVGRADPELLVDLVDACARLGDEGARRRASRSALAAIRRTTNRGTRAYALAHLAALSDGGQRRVLFRRALVAQREIARAGDVWGGSFVAKVIAQHQLHAGDLTGALRTRSLVSHPDLATMLATSIVEFHVARGEFDAARAAARGTMSERRPGAGAYPRLAASTLLPALERIAHEQARAGELEQVTRWVSRLRSPSRRAAARMAAAAALLGLPSRPWNP